VAHDHQSSRFGRVEGIQTAGNRECGGSDPADASELLSAGPDPNARDKHGATALMHASVYGLESVVKLLIQHGADLNLTDSEGRTALMYAAAGGFSGLRNQYYVDAIPILLANGADPDKRDNAGETALEIATKLKHQFAVELLKPAGH
jgi:hypothetical protein